MPPGEVRRLALRHVPGEGTPEIERVSAGLVNETYRVVRDGIVYALRLAAANSADRGRDGESEACVLESAAAANIAPVPVVRQPQHGLLISRWVEGRSWTAADVRGRENIDRMADLLRRVHALPLPSPAREMSPRKWIEHYAAAAAGSGGVPIWAAAAPLRTAADLRLTELAELPGGGPVLCHSDLHTLNLIDRGDSLVLLDWEYAHAADPFWDLAGWSANNVFGAELRHELLAAYAGRTPTPSEERRLWLLCWLYDYVCLLWCKVASQDAAERGESGARVRQLQVRLAATLSSRADQVPAHYPAPATPRGDTNGELNGADDRSGPGWKGT